MEFFPHEFLTIDLYHTAPVFVIFPVYSLTMIVLIHNIRDQTIFPPSFGLNGRKAIWVHHDNCIDLMYGLR